MKKIVALGLACALTTSTAMAQNVTPASPQPAPSTSADPATSAVNAENLYGLGAAALLILVVAASSGGGGSSSSTTTTN